MVRRTHQVLIPDHPLADINHLPVDAHHHPMDTDHNHVL